MNILDALLAFSVTMLILSTMAIVVVEFYYRVRGVREQYFEKMITVFFDELIWPRVKSLFSEQQNKLLLRRQFLATMMSVSGLPTLDIKNGAVAESGPHDAEPGPLQYTSSKKTERLSASEFAQRFARTDCGIALMNAGDKAAKTLVVDLARQLDSISIGSTSNFRQRSRKCSVSVAFVLAFMLNVDALFLLKSYAYDSEQAQQLVQSVTASSAASVTALPVSIPIGWQFYPFCQPLNGVAEGDKHVFPDGRCARKSAHGFNVYDMDFINWLLGFVLAGFLIGQGSPFWFQVFQRLSIAAVLVKEMGLGGKHGQPESTSVVTDAPGPSHDPVDAFLSAARAQQLQSEQLK